MLSDLVFNALVLVLGVVGARRVGPGRRAALAAALFVLSLGLGMLGGVLFGRIFLPFRMIAWSLFLHLPLLLIVAGWELRSKAAFALAGVIFAVGADAFLLEPRLLRESVVEVRSPRLQRAWTVALVADLQTDRVGEYERAALERALAAKPDLVLFAGDYLQLHDEQKWVDGIPVFRELLREVGFVGPDAPPAYAVKGNMEWRRGWEALFEGSSVEPVLETSTFQHGELAVTALSFDASFGREPVPAAEQGFQIVFGHGPDFALERPPGQLLLAGHTHGGQVRLPFIGPLLTFSKVPRAWAAGLTRTGPEQALYVSRGVGMERGDAPRLRFNCLPELVFVHLAPGEPSFLVVEGDRAAAAAIR